MNAIVSHDMLHFRDMEETDLDEVMTIEQRVYPFCWTRTIFKDCLRVGYACRVVETEQGMAGYAVLSYGAGEAHVLNIAVAPEQQGRGIGRALLEHLLEVARRYNADTVFLEVRPSNSIALRLYDTMGFNQVGLRRGYYPSDKGREDAILLARSLLAFGG